jgi:hypothetical protein
MAPPFLLVLHVKKEDDSTSKYVTEVLHDNAPPLLPDVMDLKRQFETWTLVAERVLVAPYSFCCI